MARTSLFLAEEALALPPEEREELAKLLLHSIQPDSRSVEQLREELRARLEAVESGRDLGLSFQELFVRD